MERESFLALLIVLLGGVGLLAFGWWPAARNAERNGWHQEKLLWRRIWLPVAPALIIISWLSGWALAEPDPTLENVPLQIFIISFPFVLLFGRAAIRAGRSIFGSDEEPAIAAVGLLRPRILFSPYLAKKLDDSAIEAALEHERAHARHRDPLRILLAQLATDLQWPWPQSAHRFRDWLIALEVARDEEARMQGIEGPDIAAAIWLPPARIRRQRRYQSRR